jgi:predicted transcriptional regulator
MHYDRFSLSVRLRSCSYAMAEKFDMTRQAVSKHIKVLHECELIKPVHSGREIYYHFNAKKMQEFDHWLAQFRQNWETQFNQLDQLLTTIKEQTTK